MRRWALAAAVSLVCAAALAWTDSEKTEAVGAKLEAAEKMYVEASVVGVLVAAEKMYTAASADWYEGELKVQEVESESDEVHAGDVLTIRYQIDRRLSTSRQPGPGDAVRGLLQRQEADESYVWLPLEGLERLGRGDYLNPGEDATLDLGSPEAKVLVKLLAPLRPECHQKTAELLKEFAAREPERVRVQIFDLTDPAGRRESQRERLACATVLVNNRLRFTIEGPDGPRKVTLSKRPNTPRSGYNSEDVIMVAEQEIERLYAEEETAAAEKSAP